MIRKAFCLINPSGFIDRKFLSLLLFSSLLFSCTNIGVGSRTPSSVLMQGNPVGGYGSGSFSLDGVVADPSSSGSVYQMIGRNSEFQWYCGNSFGGCSCQYIYDQIGQGTMSSEVAISYQEANMLRCANMVPVGITNFKVRILVAAGGSGGPFQSNVFDASLGPGGTLQDSGSYLDLTDSESYLPVQRYQCRKLEFIGSPFDQSFLDPFQSQDPHVIYPFNFYTTNVAESVLAMQRTATTSGWECTITPNLDNSVHWWANPMVFSKTACTSSFCAGDGELLYPTTSISSGRVPASVISTATGKRRASFSLLRRPYGVFQVPVIAATAPLNYVSSRYSLSQVDQNLTLGALGYAAKAVIGLGGTSCPSISIPTNARWVKLWNFRLTDFKPAKKVLASSATLSTTIGCFTRTSDSSSVSGVFWSCASSRGMNALNAVSASVDTNVASRIGIFPGNANPNPSACYQPQSIPALDQWQPSSYGWSSTAASDFQNYPWGLYASATNPTGPSPTTIGGLTPGVPSDPIITGQAVDLSPDNYTDHLFVVSDPTLSEQDFEGSGSSNGNQYFPVTYKTKSACSGTAQASCADGDRLTWLYESHDVNNPTGPRAYPLCVLQFTE